MSEPERASEPTPNIHIIDETEEHLLLAVRIAKTALVANMAFIHAIFELASLLLPERRQPPDKGN